MTPSQCLGWEWIESQLMFDWYICFCRHSASYWLTVEEVLIKGQPSTDWMSMECWSRCWSSVDQDVDGVSTEVLTKVLTEGIDPMVDAFKCTWSNFNIKAFHGVLGSCNVTHGSKYQCSLVLLWTFLTNYTVAILKISIYLALKNPIITIWKKNSKWLLYFWKGPFWTFALNTCIFKLEKCWWAVLCI